MPQDRRVERHPTLADERSADVEQRSTDARVYHDRDSLPFHAEYPIIEFKPERLPVNAPDQLLHQQLLHNYWYQKGNTLDREEMLARCTHVNHNLGIVLDFFDRQYGHLGFRVEHISIAGSYPHAAAPGDIDFDVVVNGSFFDYVSFNEGIERLDVVGSVRKISLIVMGLDNISGAARTPDRIRNRGFTHYDTIIREMIVAPMRNITVYGRPFDQRGHIDSRNVLVRIARQLYFAELTLDGKIPYYQDDPLRTRKAIRRVREAYEIIEWLLDQSETPGRAGQPNGLPSS